MSSFAKMFSSSIGKKLTVALTGLFLCTFLVIHVIGNIQLFYNDQGLAFNSYTVFMTSNPLIKTVSYILYASILFHAFKGLHLVYQNRKARPAPYVKVNGAANSMWSSRNMGLLGTIILIFIVVHMSDFWGKYHFGHIPYVQYTENMISGEISAQPYVDSTGAPLSIASKQVVYVNGDEKVTILKDLYKEVQSQFKQPLLVILYICSMAAIAFHLLHGFKSGFQSLGLNHSKYNAAIKFTGTFVFAILIPVVFALMPLYFFFIK